MNAPSNLKIGQKVDLNTVIGVVGSTGNSSDPHLHINIEVNGTKQNPANYLPVGSSQNPIYPKNWNGGTIKSVSEIISSSQVDQQNRDFARIITENGNLNSIQAVEFGCSVPSLPGEKVVLTRPVIDPITGLPVGSGGNGQSGGTTGNTPGSVNNDNNNEDDDFRLLNFGTVIQTKELSNEEIKQLSSQTIVFKDFKEKVNENYRKIEECIRNSMNLIQAKGVWTLDFDKTQRRIIKNCNPVGYALDFPIDQDNKPVGLTNYDSKTLSKDGSTLEGLVYQSLVYLNNQIKQPISYLYITNAWIDEHLRVYMIFAASISLDIICTAILLPTLLAASACGGLASGFASILIAINRTSTLEKETLDFSEVPSDVLKGFMATMILTPVLTPILKPVLAVVVPFVRNGLRKFLVRFAKEIPVSPATATTATVKQPLLLTGNVAEKIVDSLDDLIISFSKKNNVVNSLKNTGKLPNGYITKQDATNLG